MKLQIYNIDKNDKKRKEKKRGNEKMHIEGQAMHWPKDKMYQ